MCGWLVVEEREKRREEGRGKPTKQPRPSPACLTSGGNTVAGSVRPLIALIES
jgi:hypothetical protein